MYKILANTIFLGKDVQFLPECHSTNDKALELAKSGRAIEGTIVITDHQTKGKGQRGNTWKSTKGENITFSLILKPDILDISEQFILNMMISNSLREVLGNYVPDLKVKWPNDLMVPDFGKLGGVLIENVVGATGWEYAVVGIGLNINQKLNLPDRAVSLKSMTGSHFDRNEIFRSLVVQIEQNYIKLRKQGKANILENYLSHLYQFEEWKAYESEGKVFQGMITGINSSGQLIVKDEAGKENLFDLKELRFL